MGDKVRVANDCYDDSEPRRPLASGSEGRIETIDSEGDFEIEFNGAQPFWIFRQRSSMLLRHTCMESILMQFRRIRDDFVSWKRQAVTQ